MEPGFRKQLAPRNLVLVVTNNPGFRSYVTDTDFPSPCHVLVRAEGLGCSPGMARTWHGTHLHRLSPLAC